MMITSIQTSYAKDLRKTSDEASFRDNESDVVYLAYSLSYLWHMSSPTLSYKPKCVSGCWSCGHRWASSHRKNSWESIFWFFLFWQNCTAELSYFNTQLISKLFLPKRRHTYQLSLHQPAPQLSRCRNTENPRPLLIDYKRHICPRSKQLHIMK